MNLHDWIDELCDVLDVEVDVDEALVLDLARDAAHNVERPAAPITTFLLGYAAADQASSGARRTIRPDAWSAFTPSASSIWLPESPPFTTSCGCSLAKSTSVLASATGSVPV